MTEIMLDIYSILFHPLHCGLELGVSIQEHQGFPRHQNVAVHALRRSFRRYDVNFLMILSK